MNSTDMIREKCSAEIAFLKDLTAYETDLVPFNSIEEAETTVCKWIDDGIDVPDRFICAPGLLMVVWNLFITPAEA